MLLRRAKKQRMHTSTNLSEWKNSSSCYGLLLPPALEWIQSIPCVLNSFIVPLKVTVKACVAKTGTAPYRYSAVRLIRNVPLRRVHMSRAFLRKFAVLAYTPSVLLLLQPCFPRLPAMVLLVSEKESSAPTDASAVCSYEQGNFTKNPVSIFWQKIKIQFLQVVLAHMHKKPLFGESLFAVQRRSNVSFALEFHSFLFEDDGAILLRFLLSLCHSLQPLVLKHSSNYSFSALLSFC